MVVFLSGYRAHAHKSSNRVHIIHCQEVEHPAGENYPDYAVARMFFLLFLMKSKKKKIRIDHVLGHIFCL